MSQMNKSAFLALFAITQPERLSGHIPHCTVTRHYISSDFVQEGCPRYIKWLFKNLDIQQHIHKPRQSQHSVTNICKCPFLKKRKIYTEWQNLPIF